MRRVDAVIRTAVVTDLVGSTALLEKLGDERASGVFAQCDRIARNLLEGFGGREIDKTDGFLLLFDRPIDACRYVIAYHEKLAELSAELGVALSARVGIHLGEVFLRENSPEDIARGAKPIEVEGLAKPTAARIAGLAQGRQTLLTRSAFELARRAAVSKTVSDKSIQWMAHGPYLFKGVDEPVEVFEVGVLGFAPLSIPPDSEKARRAVAAGDETAPGEIRDKSPKAKSSTIWIAAMVALMVVAAIAVAPGLNRRGPAEPASIAAAVPPVALRYWITVQKYRDGKPFEEPFRLAREINFEKDYRIRIHFNFARPGFLYLVSESPDKTGSVSAYNLIAATSVDANQEKQVPEQSWFQFDGEKGSEKVWIVWSGKSVPELEAGAKFINTKDRGTINDAGIRDAVRAFLESNISQTELEKDDLSQLTRVRANEDPVVYLLKLEHH